MIDFKPLNQVFQPEIIPALTSLCVWESDAKWIHQELLEFSRYVSKGNFPYLRSNVILFYCDYYAVILPLALATFNLTERLRIVVHYLCLLEQVHNTVAHCSPVNVYRCCTNPTYMLHLGLVHP